MWILKKFSDGRYWKAINTDEVCYFEYDASANLTSARMSSGGIEEIKSGNCVKGIIEAIEEGISSVEAE